MEACSRRLNGVPDIEPGRANGRAGRDGVLTSIRCRKGFLWEILRELSSEGPNRCVQGPNVGVVSQSWSHASASEVHSYVAEVPSVNGRVIA